MYIYVNLISVSKDYLSFFLISVKKFAFCVLLFVSLHRQNEKPTFPHDKNKIVLTAIKQVNNTIPTDAKSIF